MEGVKKIYNNIMKFLCDDCMYWGVEFCNNMKVFVISDLLIDKFVVVLDVYIGKIFMKKYDKFYNWILIWKFGYDNCMKDIVVGL